MSDRYYGLISSLPHLSIGDGIDFRLVRMPISREGLKARLRDLSPKDLDQIKAIIDFQQGLYLITEINDRQVCDMLMQTIKKLTTPGVLGLFMANTEVWLILEALHQRHQGVEYLLPPVPIVGHMRRNWSHPDFSLAGRLPWLPTARELLEKHKILDLEKYIDQVRWQIPDKLGITDPFSFESVVAYVGRWEILYRWNQVSQQKGQQRFDQLVESVLQGAL
jgi:hypothetical protein